jgi:hypothetical protein
MTYLATYPKFSSIESLDFELQQMCAKLSFNFHSNSSGQKYGNAL